VTWDDEQNSQYDPRFGNDEWHAEPNGS
jgi:hypothetical protein